MGRLRIDGTNFEESFESLKSVFDEVREHRRPYLIQAKVALLGHNTSGVRMDFYRSQEDLKKHALDDPIPKLRSYLVQRGIADSALHEIQSQARGAASFCSAPYLPTSEYISPWIH